MIGSPHLEGCILRRTDSVDFVVDVEFASVIQNAAASSFSPGELHEDGGLCDDGGSGVRSGCVSGSKKYVSQKYYNQRMVRSNYFTLRFCRISKNSWHTASFD